MKSHLIKILLIDNNEGDYLLFRDMLSGVHCSESYLLWITDGKDGPDYIQQSGCDICLVDCCLEGRTGLDLLKEAVNAGCRVPIIFLTDREDRDLALEAMRAGAADCLAKEKLSAPLLERSIYHARERGKRNDELLGAKRVIQSLSDCIDAVVRIKDEMELLGEICRIVVEVGGYRMAWVGYVDRDEARSVIPVEKYGYEEGYLESINIIRRDDERGRNPAGASIRSGAPSIIRFVQNDPNFEPWRREAIERGYASACGLPLFLESRVLGALTVYSSEPDAFGAEELELLIRLSSNLSYGIEALRAHKRERSEEALQAVHEQFKEIIEFLPDATFVVDREGKVIAWNRAIEEMTGVPKERMIGMGDYAYAVPFYGEPRPILIDLVMKNIDGHIDLYDFTERQDKLLRGEVFAHETYESKGAYLWGTASPLLDMNGNLIGAVEAIRDITKLKQIESVLLKREADLEEKAHQFVEINTALKVLLRQREEDKQDLEESLLTNVKESITPFLEKLKKTRLDENQATYLGIVESQLGEIVSPFLKRLTSRFTNLTPMEIKVAKLIKDGRTSKEIAEILGVAELTILTHRNNLRAKLGLRNEKTNLRSHLMSLI